MGERSAINLSDVAADTPLRLDVAAALKFPDGSMTARGLRREIARGRLAFARVAGKDYTTLRDLDEMVKLCRHERKARDCGHDPQDATSESASPIPPSGSSSTEDISKAHAAASMIVQALKKNSGATSPKSISSARRKGNVIPIKSRSPTC